MIVWGVCICQRGDSCPEEDFSDPLSILSTDGAVFGTVLANSFRGLSSYWTFCQWRFFSLLMVNFLFNNSRYCFCLFFFFSYILSSYTLALKSKRDSVNMCSLLKESQLNKKIVNFYYFQIVICSFNLCSYLLRGSLERKKIGIMWYV